ncbi:MAG: hypothetical protein V1858_02105 [Candidatus Gottesmanbacteria bacterium]
MKKYKVFITNSEKPDFAFFARDKDEASCKLANFLNQADKDNYWNPDSLIKDIKEE